MGVNSSKLGQEWTTLQNNFELYERSGLLVKLISIVLFSAGVAAGWNGLLIGAMVLVLWVQEGIFRTYQSRLGLRLLRVESLLKLGEQSEGAAFQLHSEWLAGRPGVTGLLTEYAASACRPTVAFPYAVLILFVVIASSGVIARWL